MELGCKILSVKYVKGKRITKKRILLAINKRYKPPNCRGSRKAK